MLATKMVKCSILGLILECMLFTGLVQVFMFMESNCPLYRVIVFSPPSLGLSQGGEISTFSCKYTTVELSCYTYHHKLEITCRPIHFLVFLYNRL